MPYLRLAADLKRKQKSGIPPCVLVGKGLAMLFEKPSLRTRVTFEIGMIQLGGHVVFLGGPEVKPRNAGNTGRLRAQFEPLDRYHRGAYVCP